MGNLATRAIRVCARRFHLTCRNPIYALILAGGSGERFWPLSRRARPKQLLRWSRTKRCSKKPSLGSTGLVPHERILILTNVEQEAAVRALLPDFPHGKHRRRTGEARHGGGRRSRRGLGRARAIIMATMIVLPADHVIKDTRGISKDPDDGGGGGGRDRRAGHHWHQADLGLPGIWLHRAGQAAASAKVAPSEGATFIRSCAFAKNRTPSWRNRSSGREISAGTPECLSGRCRPS